MFNWLVQHKRSITAATACLFFLCIVLAVASEMHLVRQEALCDDLWSCAEDGENNCVVEKLKEGADPGCSNGEPTRRAKQGGHNDTVEILNRAMLQR
jgi:hypothetical protein